MDRYMVGDPTDGNSHTNLPVQQYRYSTYSHTVSRHTGTVSTGTVPVQDRYRTLIPVSYTGILYTVRAYQYRRYTSSYSDSHTVALCNGDSTLLWTKVLTSYMYLTKFPVTVSMP